MNILATVPRSERNFAQRLSPRLKLAVALVVVSGTALLPRHVNSIYAAPAIILFVLWIICRMPVVYALRRLLVAECFIIGLVLLSVVSPGAWPVVGAALVKSNLCILAMLLLTWTTPFQEIVETLRWLRLPSVIVTTLALMYRYLPVLTDESRRMQRARAARTFSPRRRLAWHSVAALLGQLFVRSAERAERIYLAMCARGWK